MNKIVLNKKRLSRADKEIKEEAIKKRTKVYPQM
jgi:hypothetical protein